MLHRLRRVLMSLFWLATFVLPWPVRRRLMTGLLGYELHPTSRIGLSWVFPRSLAMGPNASIGHLTVFRNVGEVVLGEYASIGNRNWIAGNFQAGRAFWDQPERRSALHIHRHGVLTSSHVVDCTDAVTIGEFSTVAGCGSQLMTHGIDVEANRQRCGPISIGRYALVGTGSVVLGGARIPDFCVLGAGSVLNKAFDEPYTLLAGVPAQPKKRLSEGAGYFNRAEGFVL